MSGKGCGCSLAVLSLQAFVQFVCALMCCTFLQLLVAGHCCQSHPIHVVQHFTCRTVAGPLSRMPLGTLHVLIQYEAIQHFLPGRKLCLLQRCSVLQLWQAL